MRYFMILFLILICCSKNATSPDETQVNNRSGVQNSEIISGGKFELGPFGAGSRWVIKCYDDNGNLSAQWYGDWGSGYSKLQFTEAENEWLDINYSGIGFNSRGRFGALQVSQTGYPELVLINGEIKCKLDAEGGGWADMGLEYRVAGKRVVGPRLAAIADATSPEDMVLKFNLLLSRLREHGLIER